MIDRVVTFFRCDWQVHSHGYSSFYSEIMQVTRSTYWQYCQKGLFWISKAKLATQLEGELGILSLLCQIFSGFYTKNH